MRGRGAEAKALSGQVLRQIGGRRVISEPRAEKCSHGFSRSPVAPCGDISVSIYIRVMIMCVCVCVCLRLRCIYSLCECNKHSHVSKKVHNISRLLGDRFLRSGDRKSSSTNGKETVLHYTGRTQFTQNGQRAHWASPR